MHADIVSMGLLTLNAKKFRRSCKEWHL